MVRERTCTAIARLLGEGNAHEDVWCHLKAWMESQTLESVATHVLLIWVRLRSEDPSAIIPDSTELISAFPRHSILSWLLIEELYGTELPQPNWNDFFSPGLAKTFKPENFFLERGKYFIPQIYITTANEISRKTGCPFLDQWGWEWEILLRTEQLHPDKRVLEFRDGANSGRHVSYDFKLSEIFRSAYLRTLAWAAAEGFLDKDWARIHAAKCCPIDVGLWKVKMGHPPEWWPRLPDQAGTFDQSVELVIAHLGNLWQEREAALPRDWQLAQCNGLIRGKGVHVELEIYAVFQRCLGPVAPDLKTILEDCRWRVFDPIVYESLVKFSGRLLRWPHEKKAKRMEDWELTPAFTRVETPIATGWEWWRHWRQVWAPALTVMGDELRIEVLPDGIDYVAGQYTLGQWRDWAAGLRDVRDRNLPPETGQVLFVRGDAVDAYCEKTKSAFCWIWKLTAYHKKSASEDYKEISFEGIFGASNIIVDRK